MASTHLPQLNGIYIWKPWKYAQVTTFKTSTDATECRLIEALNAGMDLTHIEVPPAARPLIMKSEDADLAFNVWSHIQVLESEIVSLKTQAFNIYDEITYVSSYASPVGNSYIGGRSEEYQRLQKRIASLIMSVTLFVQLLERVYP